MRIRKCPKCGKSAIKCRVIGKAIIECQRCRTEFVIIEN